MISSSISPRHMGVTLARDIRRNMRRASFSLRDMSYARPISRRLPPQSILVTEREYTVANLGSSKSVFSSVSL